MRLAVLFASAVLSMGGPDCALAQTSSQQCVDCLKAQWEAWIDEAVFTGVAFVGTLASGGTLFAADMAMASVFFGYEADTYFKIGDCSDICYPSGPQAGPQGGPPPSPQPICDVNKPLLKAGDNANGTMRVSSNFSCTCGFERSDGWVTVVTQAHSGTATASGNACSYKSNLNFSGADWFMLQRGWPEGGTATVLFLVTVVK